MSESLHWLSTEIQLFRKIGMQILWWTTVPQWISSLQWETFAESLGGSADGSYPKTVAMTYTAMIAGVYSPHKCVHSWRLLRCGWAQFILGIPMVCNQWILLSTGKMGVSEWETVERMQFHLDPQTLKTAPMFTHNRNLQTALMGLQLAPTAGPSGALIHSPQSMMWW